MTEQCARYDVSRKTGDKWLERFDEAGPKGCTIEVEPRTSARTGSRMTSRP